MAYQTIGTYNVYEWEQPEIIDQTTAGGETVKIVQEYARVTADLIIKQERYVAENRSNFIAELWLYATAGENGDGFSFNPSEGRYGGSCVYIPETAYGSASGVEYVFANRQVKLNVNTTTVAPGETVSVKVAEIDLSTNVTRWRLSNGTASDYDYNLGKTIYHKIDGSFPPYISHNNNEIRTQKLIFNGGILVYLYDILIKDSETNETSISGTFSNIEPTPLPIDRAVIPVTANNFIDEEENPVFTYSASAGKSYITETYSNTAYRGYNVADTIVSLQACLSFDGETPAIPYRDIPIGGTSYTFELTEAEREALRQQAQGSDTVPIYYLTKVIRNVSYKSLYTDSLLETATLIGDAQRLFTVVGCNPSLNPTVKDVNSTTLALTGNENTFIRYESMAEYAFNATASKGATIVTQSVTCGTKTVEGLPNGVIDDVESGTFVFYVLDSRGMAAQASVFKDIVEYVKPTCKQEVTIEMSGETGATATLKASGFCFMGSFGKVGNSFNFQVRYKQGNGAMSEWFTPSISLTRNGVEKTYEAIATFTGLSYDEPYTFQSRIIDSLNTVESSQYTIRLLPVFDWSETDFNFNVPVNIEAEDLNMHGETIIRHSETTNNTVLSASDGNIYVRPGGTDSTYGETIFYANGNVKFNGTVTFADGSTGGGASDPTDAFADYVIEAGSTSMGSNGTWYWRKWNSGTAEAWGCRNFGNMAVTTAWGNLYRSAVFTQNLPDNVFIRTPDAININIVHSNFGGWICKHEQTAPSAATTGSFIFVRPASATVTPTNIGFYIVGEWK